MSLIALNAWTDYLWKYWNIEHSVLILFHEMVDLSPIRIHSACHFTAIINNNPSQFRSSHLNVLHKHDLAVPGRSMYLLTLLKQVKGKESNALKPGVFAVHHYAWPNNLAKI